MQKNIEVRGARMHNLKDIDVDIPKNKLTVITGISGSGKSSLAFDTIHAEGQRRYMESFSAYARQFIGNMERPDVDLVRGLSPVISIEQKTTSKNPRSTVGTITEIYDFFRLLYARAGTAYSYNTNKPMVQYSEEKIVKTVKQKFKGKKIGILAPIIQGRKGHYRELFEQLRKQGHVRVRVDGKLEELKPKMQVDRFKIHDIEIVIDRLRADAKNTVRISQSIETALRQAKGTIIIMDLEEEKSLPRHGVDTLYSKNLVCAETGISYMEPSPNTFSYNSPYGYCPTCKGLGVQTKVDLKLVMPDKTLSISEGGIKPLGKKRDAHAFNQIKVVARENKIKLTVPVSKLTQKQLNVILYGSVDGENEIDYNGNFSRDFEGVVNMVKRWYHNSTSIMVKRWAEEYMQVMPCETCEGARLKQEALWFKVADKNIAEISAWNLDQLGAWTAKLPKHLNKKQQTIAKEILKEINERIGFMLGVGLHYLTLDRPSGSLSGGESQRIRLATQIGSKLKGITYILDEPSIGLHQRDNQRLITALKELRDVGNTVIVVEHDKDIMLEADYLIDIGPGAGTRGGALVGEGTPKKFLKNKGTTAEYIIGKQKIEVPTERRKGNGKKITLKGVSGNNLKNIDVSFPLGKFICVTGVSGSGKSTLINNTFYPIISKHVYKSKRKIMPYKSVTGLKHLDKVVEIDQSPIGRTPRSNPATYCGFYTDIRTLFAEIPESKIRGYKPGRFSFNVKTGRCEICEGAGVKTIEMNFLPDVHVHCEKCGGKRFNKETLEIKYKGKTISDVLDMTVDEAVDFFEPVFYIHRKIKTLQDVGLGYITLGQSSVTLSGGEAQRVKLSSELAKKATGQTIYILDEPTTGLHFQDIKMLIAVLDALVEKGNTVLVIEHNLDVVKVADHIIDLGPEGGDGGGEIIAEGTPEEVAKNKKSITGKFLKLELN